MVDDIDEHVAAEFHGLVSDLQRGDLAQFEEEQSRQAAARRALRAEAKVVGLSAGDLLKLMDGDPADVDRKVQGALDKVEREAKAAVAGKVKQDPLPGGHFPPPPDSE